MVFGKKKKTKDDDDLPPQLRFVRELVPEDVAVSRRETCVTFRHPDFVFTAHIANSRHPSSDQWAEDREIVDRSEGAL